MIRNINRAGISWKGCKSWQTSLKHPREGLQWRKSTGSTQCPFSLWVLMLPWRLLLRAEQCRRSMQSEILPGGRKKVCINPDSSYRAVGAYFEVAKFGVLSALGSHYSQGGEKWAPPKGNSAHLWCESPSGEPVFHPSCWKPSAWCAVRWVLALTCEDGTNWLWVRASSQERTKH